MRLTLVVLSLCFLATWTSVSYTKYFRFKLFVMLV